jgi:hypothetical protein
MQGTSRLADFRCVARKAAAHYTTHGTNPELLLHREVQPSRMSASLEGNNLQNVPFSNGVASSLINFYNIGHSLEELASV